MNRVTDMDSFYLLALPRKAIVLCRYERPKFEYRTLTMDCESTLSKDTVGTKTKFADLIL